MAQEIIFAFVQYLLYFVLLVAGAVVFGKAFYKIYKGEPVFCKRLTLKLEGKLFSFMGIDGQKPMTAKNYILSITCFSVLSLVIFIAGLMLQGVLPLNPEKVDGMNFALAFNTAVSFVTNTNWQAYSGETGLSYLSQMTLLTVQNFLSGAVGISVLFALMRGFLSRGKTNLGNFWADIIRITIFMLPVCFVASLLLVMDGVPQTFLGSVSYTTLEGEKGILYLGPGASQIVIKQLFTNGGGFWGVNSAHPYENPTPFTNLIQTLSILWIPAGLCFTFGKAVKEENKGEKTKNQGIAIFKAMTILFVVCLAVCTCFEYMGGIKLQNVASFGNIEGKEVRFGVAGSSLWAVATTSASNGSVNAMHDSFTSLGGMITLFLMMLGEIVYGGVGCGLYGMISFVILTVFIAGLMVGRTPEYLNKKIGSFDMKMVCLIILTPVLCLLISTAATVMLKSAQTWSAPGAHGFTQILYAFASMSNNNGSAFAGLNVNNTWVNIVGGIVMLLVRYIPMFATVYLASSLGRKKQVASSQGTLQTTTPLFIGLLIAVILIVGALSFFPALSLGPIAEFLN